MSFINVEIKARTNKSAAIRNYLLNNGAEFKGVDEQIDTYFKVEVGRLKLRQAQIENNLIYYNRPDLAGPKQSDFDLLKVEDVEVLLNMLAKAIGIKVVVHKKREIYYIQNVKFHLDFLDGLGEFVEIEASNKFHPIETSKLREQCAYYVKEFEIEEGDLLNLSYSDMFVERDNEHVVLGK
jgi:predicted adenylyl cyclase CyaB